MLNNNDDFRKALDSHLKHVVMGDELKDKIRANAYNDDTPATTNPANNTKKRVFNLKHIAITAVAACLIVAVSIGIYTGALAGFGRPISDQNTESLPATEGVLPPANTPDDTQTPPLTPDASPSFVSPPILVDIPPPDGAQPVPSEVGNVLPSEHLQAATKTSKIFM